MASVTRLPSNTQSKLRSTQILTSLPQVISELIQNALDAHASQVEVGVDCEDWSCWVRDDGVGMSKSDLTAFESVGRYGTSKAYSPESLGDVSTFGFRGEALASVSDLCCLEICSRTLQARETWSIIMKGGQTLYNGPATRWRREKCGTVVCVRDAFYNLPIRRRSHPSSSRTLELIRKDIETLALVFPQVSFNLENTHKNDTTRPERRRIITIPKTTSNLAAFKHLFGRALVEHVEEINETYNNITITGFISLEGTSSKSYQYLYINRHILNHCDLHRLVDSTFSSSTFSKHAFDEYMELSQPLTALRRSPHKSDKKPVYVLNLTISPRDVDNCVEPAKAAVTLQNADVVHTFLTSVIRSFLVKHGFKTQPKPSQPRAKAVVVEHGTPRKRRRLDQCQDASGIANRRVGLTVPQGPAPMPMIIPGENTDVEEEANLLWTDPRTGHTFVVDKRTGNSYPLQQDEGREGTEAGTSNSRRTLRLKSASKKPAGSLKQSIDEQLSDVDSDATPPWIREALGANEAYALNQLQIPTVTLSTSFVNSLSDATNCVHPSRRSLNCLPYGQDKVAHQQQLQKFGLNNTHVSRFSKDELRNARVLGQVDRKFIACVMDSSEDGECERSLVLIDQHAAHERVRVERLLNELCEDRSSFVDGVEQLVSDVSDGPRRRSLDPPVLVLLTRDEAAQLARSAELQNAFSRWGVEFDGLNKADVRGENEVASAMDFLSTRRKAREQQTETEDSGYAQVAIRTVPEVVASKLLMENHLRDLIKNYIVEWESFGYSSISPTPTPSQSQSQPQPQSQCQSPDKAATWQRKIRRCPRDLVELINSKACRGAIMFNDVLKPEQCERLVKMLSETAVPFQCAHGRPSLVPLARLKTQRAADGMERSSRVITVDWASFEQ